MQMFTIVTSILLIIYSNENIISHFKYFQINTIKIDFSSDSFFILVKY